MIRIPKNILKTVTHIKIYLFYIKINSFFICSILLYSLLTIWKFISVFKISIIVTATTTPKTKIQNLKENTDNLFAIEIKKEFDTNIFICEGKYSYLLNTTKSNKKINNNDNSYNIKKIKH